MYSFLRHFFVSFQHLFLFKTVAIFDLAYFLVYLLPENVQLELLVLRVHGLELSWVQFCMYATLNILSWKPFCWIQVKGKFALLIVTLSLVELAIMLQAEHFFLRMQTLHIGIFLCFLIAWSKLLK